MQIERTKTLGGAAVVAAAMWCLPVSEARADDDDTVVVRTAPTRRALLELPSTPVVAGRELMWSRMVLGDDYGWRIASRQAPLRFPILAGLDTRDDLWLAAPRAITSVASAAGSILTSGIGVFDVVRGGKIRQRHSLRGYFRSGGLKLVWRVKF